VGKWSAVFGLRWPVLGSVRWFRAPHVAAATLSSGLIRPSCNRRASCVVHAVSGSGKLSPAPAVLGSSMVAISLVSSTPSVLLGIARHCRATWATTWWHKSVTFLLLGITSRPEATRAVRMDWISAFAFFRFGWMRDNCMWKFRIALMVTLSCSSHPRNDMYAPR
jgi:hypothetical protein